ncbi:hypothetical protein CPB86DRAFT_877372 [Serendipita vermifera]|nr:hypothetical protein CPB86DRAFT_877372 [Serendipita vermifera]
MEGNNEQGQGIRILSLDGGGPGCYSQLVILKEIMSRIAYDEEREPEELLPGDYFDFIGGTGFGAYISFMLGILRMNIDDTIDGLLALADSLFPQCDPSIARSPDENLEVVKRVLVDMLKRHGLPRDVKLSDPQLRSSKSKVVIIAASADDVSHCKLFKTYRSPQDSTICTVLEALCASLATPPLFDPIPVGPRLRQERFIGGALGFYNPTREMLKEVEVAYGDDQPVALILSLGTGAPPVISLDSSSSLSQSVEVLVQYMAIDCERVAREMANQMIQVDAYVRLNVSQGLEQLRFDDWSCIGSIEGRIKAYLQAVAVTRAVDAASEKITKRIESITVGHLIHSTRIKHMANPVPSVSPYYVVRRDEWEVMTSHLVVKPKDKRKVFVVTGMGGCGKTQMVAYFVEKHRKKYRNIFFIDATSSATIRGDLESAIRSLDGHEQDTYEDSLVFMSSHSEMDEWLYILDNADDPTLELNQYLPSCYHGTIIITSRNSRVGDLATTHHLELGKMQETEAVETLCRAARKTIPLGESELTEAIQLVETVGYLALAIVQAGIYVHEMSSGRGGRFTFAQYFTLYKDHRERLLRQKARASLDQYLNSVYTTLDISYTKLPDQCREFLHLCSFFRHTSIVTSIFSCATEADFEDSWELEPSSSDQQDIKLRLQRIFSGKGRWDGLQFHEMVQVLSSFSLLFISSVNNLLLLRLHPLVHSHARDTLDPADLPMYKQMAITCVSTSHSQYLNVPTQIRGLHLYGQQTHEMPGGQSENFAFTLNTQDPRYVILCPLNNDTMEIPRTLQLYENTTYLQVNDYLNSLTGWKGYDLTLLSEVFGPWPAWVYPSKDAVISGSVRKLYVVDLNRPHTLALLRTETTDLPVVIDPAILIQSSYRKVRDIMQIILHNDRLKVQSVTTYESPQDIGDQYYNHYFFQTSTSYPTCLRIMPVYASATFELKKEPRTTRFLPVPFQMAINQCERLLDAALDMHMMSMQCIHIALALLHLSICSCEEEDGFEYLVNHGLQRAIDSLETVIDFLRNDASPWSKAEEMRDRLDKIFLDCCGDFPGAVSVRQSLDTYKKMISEDIRDWQEQASQQVRGSSTEEEPTGLQRSNNLGVVYIRQPKRPGGFEDAKSAISVLQKVVRVILDGYADKPSLLNNLGSSLLRRFERLDGLEDVESAISVLQNAVDLTPDGHADKPLEDVESAISVLQNAVELTPDGHGDKPSCSNNLASALLRRFERLDELDDVERAISVFQGAPSGLNNLGSALQARFHCSSDMNDLNRALSSFRSAANSLIGTPSHLFRAARSWAQCEVLSSGSPLPAFSRAIRLLPHIAWLGLSVVDQHTLLAQVEDVVRDAVNAAIEHDDYETAVEWAEQGRSLVWQNLLNLRTPVDQLAQSHPDLADRLGIISRQLETSMTRGTTFGRAEKSGLEEAARRHRELSIEQDKLIDQIRQIPEFKSFMRPKKFHELSSVAHQGPVVILNVHKSRSDALVLIPGDSDVSVVVIPLEGFSYKTCENMQKKMNDLLLVAQVRSTNIRKHGWGGDHGNDSMFKRILGILWKQVVRPVIDGLAYRVNLDDPPRIWWCPTGPLAFLPIHAAGLYDETEVGNKVSDYVISSFCPTLSALLESPRSTVQSAWKMVAVAQPFTPGQSPIPETEEEVRKIIQVGPGLAIDSLIGASATVNNVSDAMKNTHWIHLACHGQQCVGNAMDSGLLLHDGKLKLSDLVKESLPNAEFAFLSACQTATGDDAIAEESTHLAAGMLLAGYQSVIATMWSIQDNDAPRVVEDVYGRMFKEGKPNRMEAARALHEAVKRLTESGASFLSWVPFIHVGR